MNRVKKFAGMVKGSPKGPVRKEEDESLVLFGELYRHEKEKDVNLLEPMFSVEFDAIQGEWLLCSSLISSFFFCPSFLLFVFLYGVLWVSILLLLQLAWD